jgi:hypothetical protein
LPVSPIPAACAAKRASHVSPGSCSAAAHSPTPESIPHVSQRTSTSARSPSQSTSPSSDIDTTGRTTPRSAPTSRFRSAGAVNVAHSRGPSSSDPASVSSAASASGTTALISALRSPADPRADTVTIDGRGALLNTFASHCSVRPASPSLSPIAASSTSPDSPCASKRAYSRVNFPRLVATCAVASSSGSVQRAASPRPVICRPGRSVCAASTSTSAVCPSPCAVAVRYVSSTIGSPDPRNTSTSTSANSPTVISSGRSGPTPGPSRGGSSGPGIARSPNPLPST